ncbi:hypothetical protein ASC90_21465 [Rhizobium sp. Root1220]|nr:hypothetical protein ASC90_21465 [Rhizobium sp. Root1220]
MRACSENGFLRVFEVGMLWGNNAHQQTIAPWITSFNAPNLSLVASVLGQDEAEIAPLWYGERNNTINFFDRQIRRKHLIRSRRVSPSSFKKAPYQKAIWHLAPLTFDPQTLEMLLDECPVCKQKIGWQRTLGICFCENCVDPENPHVSKTDFRDFPQPKVSAGLASNLRYVTDLIDPEVPAAALRALHPELQALGRGEVFELAVEVGRLIDQESSPPDTARPHKGGPVTPQALGDAGRALSNWPDGFYEVGERLRNNWFFRRKAGGPLWHPIRQVLQDSFFSAEIKVVVADALKGSLATTISEHSRGRLRAVPLPLEHLNKVARMSEAILEESAISGLPVPALLGCYLRNGFLCPDPHFAGLSNKGIPLIGMFEDLPLCRTAEVRMSLRDAVHLYFHGKGDPWPEVMAALRDGKLSATRIKGEDAYIDRLFVDDFQSWSGQLKTLRPGRDAEHIGLTVEERAFYLNCHSSCVATTMQIGALSRTATLAELQRFRRENITIKEIVLGRLASGEKLNLKYEGIALNRAGILPRHPAVHFRSRRAVERYYREKRARTSELDIDAISGLKEKLLKRNQIKLSPHQAKVAYLLNAGWRSREIAASMGVPLARVKNAERAIFKNCEVRSRDELVSFLVPYLRRKARSRTQ